ncbi:MAG: DNA replication/repair protein RecF [Gammaproteobacteria bacterium]
MTLERLHGRNFRCFASFELLPDPRLNVIVGLNGAGKTSLLEAIYIVGRGRSFRSGDPDTLRRSGSRAFALDAVIAKSPRRATVRIEAAAGGTEVRIDEREANGLAELAELLPVQVIEPGAHKLIEEGPARRRRFMDWGVFHVEPRFLETWRRYQRALRQRNAGLKQGATDAALAGFEMTLAECGEAVGRMRSRHVDRLRPFLTSAAAMLLGDAVDCHLSLGWSPGQPLAKALYEARSGDRRRQVTQVGPHRADLQIRLWGKAARDRVSRGEQKLLAASLILAQIDLLSSLDRSPGSLLIDDPAAELDRNRLERLLKAVLSRDAQVFITALPEGASHLPDAGRRFHVEQGKLAEML